MAFRGRAGRWAWYRARGGACLRRDGEDAPKAVLCALASLGVLLGVLNLLSVNGRGPANQDTDFSLLLMCSLITARFTEQTTQCHR